MSTDSTDPIDIHKMSVKEFAIESEDNRLCEAHIWTKAYHLEAENKRLRDELAASESLNQEALTGAKIVNSEMLAMEAENKRLREALNDTVDACLTIRIIQVQNTTNDFYHKNADNAWKRLSAIWAASLEGKA
jgi:hypothetical protein